MTKLPDPVAVFSLTAALLLGLVFGVLLPSRQTADAVGITAVAFVHILVTLGASRLRSHPPGLFGLVGTAVSGGLYWLVAVGLALVWRLLQLTDALLLAALQLGLAVAVLLVCYLFALTDKGGANEKDEGHDKGL